MQIHFPHYPKYNSLLYLQWFRNPYFNKIWLPAHLISIHAIEFCIMEFYFLLFIIPNNQISERLFRIFCIFQVPELSSNEWIVYSLIFYPHLQFRFLPPILLLVHLNSKINDQIICKELELNHKICRYNW